MVDDSTFSPTKQLIYQKSWKKKGDFLGWKSTLSSDMIEGGERGRRS
jgi:hypothetical protein